MAFIPKRSIRGALGTIFFTDSWSKVTAQAPASPPPKEAIALMTIFSRITKKLMPSAEACG
jgi:hypothetical protein